MEALWRLEDKWKLSTHKAVILLVCAASLFFMGVCGATTVFKRRSAAKRDRSADFARPKWPEAGCTCSWGGSMRRALMATVRWSGVSKWEEERNVAVSWRDGLSPSPLLGQEQEGAPSVAAVGRQSHNSESPVWQRPILMGEKCEMPRFSGLILYDGTGQPLHKQEKTRGAVRTTLRDLL